MRTRIAVFGGTFDPIHNGHLAIAREALRRWKLTRVLFVPASQPPHKAFENRTGYEHRYRMVELACRDEPEFEASRLDEAGGRSYTIRTLERLKEGIGEREREPELYYLIGADAFAEIATWHRWREVIQAVKFIVVSRPGHAYQTPAGAQVERLEEVRIPVSSSEIRRRLAAGDENVAVPPAVLEYIRRHGLYRGPGASRGSQM
ncbi:MAG: nicotinate-nucleotide adenylyltransferase [Bryobacteraceae bacterium]